MSYHNIKLSSRKVHARVHASEKDRIIGRKSYTVIKTELILIIIIKNDYEGFKYVYVYDIYKYNIFKQLFKDLFLSN